MTSQSQVLNPFELLHEQPRPHLDVDTLKSKFLKLSAPLHPDRVHHLSEQEQKEATRQFAELNSAYCLLREPRERINLLLHMETGSKPKDIQKIPPGTMDLFVEVGQFCRDFDAYVSARQSAETSPLIKVALLRQQAEWTEKTRAIHQKLDDKNSQTLADLQKVDAEWMASSQHQPFLERLENIGRLFSYLARWRQQLDEREVQLKILASN